MHSERDVDAWDLLWEIPKEVLIESRPVSSKPVVVRRVAPIISGQHLSAGKSANLSALHNKFLAPHGANYSNDAQTSERSLTPASGPSPQSRGISRPACATSIEHSALPSSHKGSTDYCLLHSISTSPPSRKRVCSPQFSEPDAEKDTFTDLAIKSISAFGHAPIKMRSGSDTSCGGFDASVQPEAPAEPPAQSPWNPEPLRPHSRGPNPQPLAHSAAANTTTMPATFGAPEGVALSEAPALPSSASPFGESLAQLAASDHLLVSTQAQNMGAGWEWVGAEAGRYAADIPEGAEQLLPNATRACECSLAAEAQPLPPPAPAPSALPPTTSAQAAPQQSPCGRPQPLPPLRRALSTTTSRLLSELRRGRSGSIGGVVSAGTNTSIRGVKRVGGGISGAVTGRCDRYRSWTGKRFFQDPNQRDTRNQNEQQEKLDTDYDMVGDGTAAAGAGAARQSMGTIRSSRGLSGSVAAGDGEAAKAGFGEQREVWLLPLSPRRRFDFSTRRRKAGGGGGAVAAVGVAAGVGGIPPPPIGRCRARSRCKRRAPDSYVAVMEEEEFGGVYDGDDGEEPFPPLASPGDDPASLPPATLVPLDEVLNEWRKHTARSLRKAPEMLLRSSTLADLAACCPTSVLSLEDVPGLARPWIRRYGQQVLDMCRNHVHLRALFEDSKIVAEAAEAEARRVAAAASGARRDDRGSCNFTGGSNGSGSDREGNVSWEELGRGKAQAEQGVACKRAKVTAGLEQDGIEQHHHHRYHHHPSQSAGPFSSDGDSAATSGGGIGGVGNSSTTSPDPPQHPQPPTAAYPSRGGSEGGGGSYSDGGSSSATSPTQSHRPSAANPTTHNPHRPAVPATAAATKPRSTKSSQGGGSAAPKQPASATGPFAGSATATLQPAASDNGTTHSAQPATGIIGDGGPPSHGVSTPQASSGKFTTSTPPRGNSQKPDAATPATRKPRGRPKGSLNRPKALSPTTATAGAAAAKNTPQFPEKSKAAAAATAALVAAAAAAPPNAWVPPPLGYCTVRRDKQLAFATTPDVESIPVSELVGLLAEAGRASAPFLETTGSGGVAARVGGEASGGRDGSSPRDVPTAGPLGSGSGSEGGGTAAVAVAASAGGRELFRVAELPSAALVAAAAVNRLGRAAGQSYLQQLRAMAAAALPAWEVRRVLACRAVCPGGGATQAAAVLRVGLCCGREEVRVAFRRLSLLVHPDKNRSEGAAEAFALVSSAASILMVSRV